jgi:hypothetical protein
VPGHGVRGSHGLRLGRAALAQVDAEHQQHRDRQELALPVLKNRRDEVAAGQVILGPICPLSRNAAVALEGYFLSLGKRSILLVGALAAALIFRRSGFGIMASLP